MKQTGAMMVLILSLCILGRLDAVSLAIREPSDLERTLEPVTCGVPLVKGFVRSVDELALRMGGTTVPAEIREVSRWSDGSLRWVHLDFQASVRNYGIVGLELVRGAPAPVESSLQVEESPDAINIETGALKVEISRKSFNLFNRVAAVSDNGEYFKKLINPHQRGLVAWAGDVEYLSALDKAPEVTVESSGPMRVVVRAEGELTSREGGELFHFVCRLYFYNGSPVVRVAFSIENRNPDIEQRVELQGLHAELPTVIRGAEGAYDMGRPDGEVQGIFGRDNAEAWVMANSSEMYTYGTQAYWEIGGSPKEQKPDEVGWISLASRLGAVGAGLRYFWQMHPSMLGVRSDGYVVVGMVPHRMRKTVRIYSGVGRTHYMRFTFLGTGEPGLIRSQVGACQKPLIATASPDYYCDSTLTFAAVPTLGSRGMPEKYREITDHVNDELELGFENMQDKIDSRTVNGTTHDSYGFMNWGDGLHYAWEPGITDPGNLSWNHHYYDLPHMCAIEFTRCGCPDWMFFFLSRVHHCMDVHMCHFDPASELDGHNRYCPSTEHVRKDPTDPDDFRSAPVFVHPNQNHSKTQGMFDAWLLTGDERLRDIAMQGLEFAASFGAYGDFDQPRGAAHQVMTLIHGYKITGDQRYLEIAKSTFEKWWDHFQNSDTKFTMRYFQVGLLLEAFIDIYEETGDQRVVTFTRQAVDWMRANRPDDIFPNMSLGLALLASKTGSSQYEDLAIRHLKAFKGVQGNPFKDFAMHGRNVARALYYLAGDGRAE